MVGIIESVGSGVTTLKKGDRVTVYDGISCGFRQNCAEGNRAYCQTVNRPFEGEFFSIPLQGIELNGGQGRAV
jgi:glutathione-independent formaldehyde dehydrogenase